MPNPTTIEIMHIDDNVGDLDLARSAFEECRPAVTYIGESDPLAGMAELARRAVARLPLPSLLVLDLNMPRARGQDVLAFLRLYPALKHMPVVMLSTSTREAELSECRRLGAHDVFHKPNTFAGLVEAAQAMLGHVA